MRNQMIQKYDLSRYPSDRDFEDAVMRDSSLTDTEKMYLIFQVHKESLHRQYPQLYYSILSVLDEAKKSIIFPYCDLPRLLKVEIMKKFTCGGYYYRLNDEPCTHLEYLGNVNEWRTCSHQELAAVVARRDEIKSCDED